jgi:translocation and assembly module TamA
MRAFFCLFFLTFLASAQAAYDFRLEIDAPSAVRSRLEKYLDVARARDDERTTVEYVEYLATTTPDEVRQLLATEGYFSARISVKFERENKARFLIGVQPGEPVRVSSVELKWSGAIMDDPQYRARLEKQIFAGWGLAAGEIFTQSAWNNAKTHVLNLASAQRYVSARLADSEALIDPQAHTAKLSLLVDSGPLFHYGPLAIHGLERYPEYLVREQWPYHEDNEYRRSDLQDLQTRLQSLPHFGFAVVDTELSPQAPYRATVRADVREVPRNKLTTGIGYTTETGLNTTLTHNYYGVFGKSWYTENTIKLAQKAQSGETALVFPRLGAGYQHRLYTGYAHTESDTLRTQTWQYGVTRSQQDFQLTRSWNIEYETERRFLSDGTVERPESLFLKFEWLRRDLDNTRDPQHGHLLQWESAAAVRGVLSDETYVRLYGRAAKYWPAWRNGVFVARLDAGQTFARVAANVPSDLLFLAGGAGSVRGYDYQSLGVAKGGSIVPGRVLLTGSGEYQIPVYRNWRLATFVDHGNASMTWPELHGVTGAGLGLRWSSAAGVFGADFANGLDEHQWKFHLAIGLVF